VRLTLRFLVLLGLLYGALALAQTAPEPQCKDAHSTAAMRECENARLKRAEEGMLAAYRRLLAKADEPGRAKLQAAQRAWARYRAAEAEYHADAARDGTLAPLIAASVRADLTEARRRELERGAGETK
jgi:uncharacterized protein YecT (DUF1311 family)